MAQVIRGKSLYGESFEVCPGKEGGLLVIFPPWLQHEVKPMPESYDGPRIGISFNAVYSPIYKMRASTTGPPSGKFISEL
jgi:hypothetical protein